MDNANTNVNNVNTSGYDFASLTGSSFNSGACMYRLPCGYCKELGRQCPYTPITTTITYGSTIDNVAKT